MNFTKQISRYKMFNKLIKDEQSGTPDEFAQKLNISRRQLYRLIEIFKDNGAPIRYSRARKSFYYAEYFDIQVSFSVKLISKEEEREIYGGQNIFAQSAFLWHGANLSLFR